MHHDKVITDKNEHKLEIITLGNASKSGFDNIHLLSGFYTYKL